MKFMKTTKAVLARLPVVVLRDRREQELSARWEFTHTARDKVRVWGETRDAHLRTGDYTLLGFEDKVAIERKASVYDFVTSLVAPRFADELKRMEDEVSHAFVILEFSLRDLYDWPRSHTPNVHLQRKLPLRHPGAAFSAYLDRCKLGHPGVDFTFAGDNRTGKLLAGSIFKRVVEAYA